MEFKEIISLLKEKGLLINYDESNLVIKDLTYNSKEVTDNSLFICKGKAFKKEYLEEAINKGATCYVSEVDYEVGIPKIIVKDILKAMASLSHKFYSLDTPLTIIGVTGTKGKTTTVNYIKDMLSEYLEKGSAYMSTIDYYTGKKRGESHNTTPESLDIARAINDAKQEDLKYLTLEISSQAHKLDRIYDMEFDYGAWLNIGNDHISPTEHSDYDDYFNCKLEFLKKCKKVIIFKHTDRYEEIIKELTGKEIITFGLTNGCDYYVESINRESNITNFTVCFNGVKEEYQISLAGSFNTLNALVAIILGKELNIPRDVIRMALLKTKVKGRMEVYNFSKCPVIVDYAHNKISAEALYKSIAIEYPGKKLKVVVGSAGGRGTIRLKELSIATGEYADFIYLTAEDPRMETVKDLCDQMITFINKYDKPYIVIEDRETAIRAAIKEATSDDVIAILGKGDEEYMVYGTTYNYYIGDSNLVVKLYEEEKEGVTINE